MNPLSVATLIFGAGGLISGIIGAYLAVGNYRRGRQSQLIETVTFLRTENKTLNDALDDTTRRNVALENENNRLRRLLSARERKDS